MSFETTVRAFAAALDDPSAATPPMTRGRMGAPDARRFAVYRNNVAVGLIGALEARYPVSRRIMGDDLFRAMAGAFVRANRPRTQVMIAYGGEFPEFLAEYLAGNPETDGRVSSPQSLSDGRASSGRPMVGEKQGGGSRGPTRQGRGDASDNLLGLRDPPPLVRSEERPSFDGLTSAPTRGGGSATVIRSAHAIASLVDLARLENAWVEAYHAQDASVATVVELAALSPDCLPNTRIAFHPAAQLLRFATPAASVWGAAQQSDSPPTQDQIAFGSTRPIVAVLDSPSPDGRSSERPLERGDAVNDRVYKSDPRESHSALMKGPGEDALVTRPDCDVRVRVLPPLAHDFALVLREGATLIEAAAAMNDPAFDFGTHLVGLVESGAVASIIPGQKS